MSQNRRKRKRKGKLTEYRNICNTMQSKLQQTEINASRLSAEVKSLEKLCSIQKQKLKAKVKGDLCQQNTIPVLHQVNRSLLSKFRKDDYLGKGTFGCVELRRFDGYYVAVKEYEHSSKDDVIKEAEIMSRMSHNNLPYLFGICTEDKPYCLVLQFCGIGGNSLTIYDALGKSECSNFPWLQLMFESADALEYLHSLGFLHNDIKTDNMLLTGDSSALENENQNVHVVLCDFGKATEVSNGRHYKLTSLQKQQYYKKHSHIAPEVIEGRYPQSKMSDIFSFGLVFYHVANRFENQRLRELAKLCTRSDPCLKCCLTDLKCKIKA